MQQTSELYKELLAAYNTGRPNIRTETRLAVGANGVLITKQGDAITFGGTSILVGATGADGGYDESLLVAMHTDFRVFSQDQLSVGGCVAAEITVEMLKPLGEVPRQARLVPYVRLTDGVRFSEWIQKGVFYVDTREKLGVGTSVERVRLHGYDSMLKAEQDYPTSTLSWPAKDVDVVREIAEYIDVSLDPRTVDILTHGYQVQYPGEYSCREVLGYIAAMYAGCFVMSDTGELRLITFYSIPKETRYLVDSAGQPITFGGVKILV